MEELGKQDPAELKRLLLERVGRSFAREAAAGDVGGQLLGREAGAGVHLLQLLGRRYAVVCTNPPYMGSKNMDALLKRYVEQHYKTGKRDLYAAFILRCLDLGGHASTIAMVTLGTWATQTSFMGLRQAILQHYELLSVVQLGRHAFGEADPPGFPHLFCIGRLTPSPSHKIVSIEHPPSMSADDQALLLAELTAQRQYRRTNQLNLAEIHSSPILLSLPPGLLKVMSEECKLGDFAAVPKGMSTSENDRFLRFFWESTSNDRWLRYAKGGSHSRWRGLLWNRVDYQYNGARLKAAAATIRNAHYYFDSGLTYTEVARGCLGVRVLDPDTLFDARSPGIFPNSIDRLLLLGILNARISSLMFRLLSPGTLLDQAYAPRVPILVPLEQKKVPLLAELAIMYKRAILSRSITDDSYADIHLNDPQSGWAETHLLICEASIEAICSKQERLSTPEMEYVYSRTGLPAGLFPLLNEYIQLPTLPIRDLDDTGSTAVETPSVMRTYASPAELARIKASLRTLYEAGPGAKGDDLDLEELDHQDDDDEGAAGAFIPIPTETFLEELSVKLQIHPISVYWLLEELRAEGVRCKPEEQRLLEDRLSVLVLRLLGHRWPRQIEAGEPVPAWADTDGVIPLTPHTGEPTLADRVRARLRAEEGDLAAQRTEALLQELTGRTLAEWLRRDFFKRHISQFKKRPIAWHLTSGGARGGGRGSRKRSGGEPAFECMVYYHRTDTDILARIRTQYVERLLERERGAVAHARRGDAPNETAIAVATERIRELEEFAARLRAVEEQGFACPALDDLLAAEPLDRWSGDGVLPPADRAALLAQEQAWRVDINDGVRVNVAPLQGAGLLASDVLAAKDLPKASADRARWRSDERRWVRAGKLPRCGWMGDDVPESPAWTDLAPARERERVRLEEKRRKVVGELDL